MRCSCLKSAVHSILHLKSVSILLLCDSESIVGFVLQRMKRCVIEALWLSLSVVNQKVVGSSATKSVEIVSSFNFNYFDF